jgi:hypothetical protein
MPSVAHSASMAHREYSVLGELLVQHLPGPVQLRPEAHIVASLSTEYDRDGRQFTSLTLHPQTLKPLTATSHLKANSFNNNKDTVLADSATALLLIHCGGSVLEGVSVS